MRCSPLILLPLAALPLGGCVASMAVSAVGAAVRAATDEGEERVILADLRPAAIGACRARAAQQGEVRIIDSEQHRDGRVVVWGTVEDPQGRRAFECSHREGEVRSFDLREIRGR